MTTSTIQARVLALSGIFQAATLVKQLARTSRADEEFFLGSIQSIFTLEANDVLEIYQDAQRLTLGLQELIRHLSTHNDARSTQNTARGNTLGKALGKMLGNLPGGTHTDGDAPASTYGDTYGTRRSQTHKDPEIVRYVLSLIHLERTLSKNPKMLALIRSGIERAHLQASHFSPTHENVIANLASLYTDTISTFRFRVQVSGEPCYLNQTHILNKVKSLLLAGIRSAVLWHQMGGRNWQLLISRGAILSAAQAWLSECTVIAEAETVE